MVHKENQVLVLLGLSVHSMLCISVYFNLGHIQVIFHNRLHSSWGCYLNSPEMKSRNFDAAVTIRIIRGPGPESTLKISLTPLVKVKFWYDCKSFLVMYCNLIHYNAIYFDECFMILYAIQYVMWYDVLWCTVFYGILFRFIVMYYDLL